MNDIFSSFKEASLGKTFDEVADLEKIVDIRLKIGTHLFILMWEPEAALLDIINEEHDLTVLGLSLIYLL